LSLSLWAADGIHTTRRAEVATDHSHLDELTATIRALEANQWGLPSVHISDRESDSISHLRDWDQEKWRYVVRAKALPFVVWEDRKMRLGEIADHLTWRPSGTVQLTAAVIAQQMVAETEVTITRPGQRRVRRGKGRVRNHEPGAPLRLRLIVVRLLLPDNGLAGEWLLLTNLGQEVSAEMIAEWYYWRWVIESYFKLCKSAGQHLEEWQQETSASIVWHTADGKRHHAILATTDLRCTAADVLRIYQARFQLEFLFRDGKQHAGLTECQARNKQALDFHFNASLATVSAARAAAVAAQTGDEPFVFSLATQKQIAFNEHFMAEISTKLGYDLSCWKNHQAYEELRSYGALAA
jgi:hypothetical protein